MNQQVSKCVAVIGSPNTTTKFRCDILDASITSPLEGRLFYLWQEEGGAKKLLLCQMMTITGYNRWHENPVLKSVIRRQGALTHLSGVTDTKEAELSLLGVFKESNGEFERSVLNTPPASGTEVYELEEDLLKKLVKKEKGIFYLGYVYGSQTPAPFYLKHFGQEPEGFGEAHHCGIFGKTGSGKSIIGAQIIGGFAKNKNMGILILDPAGEFYDNRFGPESSYNFDFHDLLRKNRGDFDLVDLSEVALAGNYTFSKLLLKIGFFQELGFERGDKQRRAGDSLNRWIEENNIRPETASLTDAVDFLATQSGYIYATRGQRDRQAREQELQERFQQNRNRIERLWNSIQNLFNPQNKTRLDQVIDRVLREQRVVILDVDKITRGFQDIGSIELKYILLYEIFRRMLYRVRAGFREGAKANCLIVLDEAHNYVPQDPGDNEDKELLLRQIITNTAETRKFGIGWMFITTSIADFHKEIYRNLHDYVYGWGLSIGVDEKHVKDIVGNEMFEVYRTLPNPKQSGIYTFMMSGGIVATGTRGSPIVIRGFSTMEELYKANEMLEDN